MSTVQQDELKKEADIVIGGVKKGITIATVVFALATVIIFLFLRDGEKSQASTVKSLYTDIRVVDFTVPPGQRTEWVYLPPGDCVEIYSPLPLIIFSGNGRTARYDPNDKGALNGRVLDPPFAFQAETAEGVSFSVYHAPSVIRGGGGRVRNCSLFDPKKESEFLGRR